MGIEYALLDNKNRLIFELGKGNWFDVDWGALTLKQLRKKVFDADVDMVWLRGLYDRLCIFIENSGKYIKLVNDVDDSLLYATEKGFVYIDTRYCLHKPLCYTKCPLAMGDLKRIMDELYEDDE